MNWSIKQVFPLADLDGSAALCRARAKAGKSSALLNRADQQAMLSADVKDVAAVLADFRVQRGPRATARALLVAAWDPEEAPDEEDGYQHKHDDDRDRHPKLASVGLTPGMNGR